MLAHELIKDVIPPLKTSDTGLKALSWMEEFRVSHLPIVNNVKFLGLLSYDDILSLNAPSEPLGNHALSLDRPFVFDNQNIYDVVKLVSRLDLTLIPVLSQDEHFLGVITLPDLVSNFAAIESVHDPGGIIVLELNKNDYVLSEIAHIIETNDAKILSSFITSNPDSTKLELTIKINKIDLSRIIASFNRYNYVVKATYHESEHDTDLQERFDSFMNYLNI
ncbi:MAG: CBS domain-containing protein [Bacteroidia bacterium]